MQDAINVGLYQYKSKVNKMSLPDQFCRGTMSPGAALLELLMGKIDIFDMSDQHIFNQKTNYTSLPFSTVKSHMIDDFNKVLIIDDISDERTSNCVNTFFRNDRRNKIVYDHILHEITQYFLFGQNSSCEGFVHLYRTLEYISYSFPMIYASSSSEYLGTYGDLKSFFSSDGGELKFFRRFLQTLLKPNSSVLNYTFNIVIDSQYSDELENLLKNEIHVDAVGFSESVMQVGFLDIMDLFLEIRNRYFHMLLGQGRNNFFGLNYEINDLFKSINPFLLNWFATIYVEILNQRMLREMQ